MPEARRRLFRCALTLDLVLAADLVRWSAADRSRAGSTESSATPRALEPSWRLAQHDRLRTLIARRSRRRSKRSAGRVVREEGGHEAADLIEHTPASKRLTRRSHSAARLGAMGRYHTHLARRRQPEAQPAGLHITRAIVLGCHPRRWQFVDRRFHERVLPVAPPRVAARAVRFRGRLPRVDSVGVDCIGVAAGPHLRI